jgi:uncharacterized membrane protein HdeD (DUF308 family)
MSSSALEAAPRRRSRRALALRGAIALLVGLYMIIRPAASVPVFALVVAIWVLSDGIIHVIDGLRRRESSERFWWVTFVNGIISIVLGVAALFVYPFVSLAYAFVWSGLWLLFSGATALVVGLEEMRAGLPWNWTMIFAVIALAGAVFALLHPAMTVSALIVLFACYAVVAGTLLLIGAAMRREPSLAGFSRRGY